MVSSMQPRFSGILLAGRKLRDPGIQCQALMLLLSIAPALTVLLALLSRFMLQIPNGIRCRVAPGVSKR